MLKKMVLVGLFVWTADLDHGTLSNAAREGCGYELETRKIDMAPFYFCGVDTDDKVCQILTYGSDDGNKPPVVIISPNELEMDERTSATLTATTTSDSKNNFTYSWTLPYGLTATSSLNQSSVTFTANSIEGDRNYIVSVRVTDFNNQSATKSVSVLVLDVDATDPELKPPLISLRPTSIDMNEGERKMVSVIATDDTTTRGTYRYLWTMPAGLTPIIPGQETSESVTFDADPVTSNKNYTISVTVTNGRGKSTTGTIPVIVRDLDSEPAECQDPDHVNHPFWDSTKIYIGEYTHKVSHRNLVWINKHYINPGEEPGVSDGWQLVSDVVLSWKPVGIPGNTFVNHNGSQWKNTYWTAPSDEPGIAPMWTRVGNASCSKQETKAKKKR